MKVRYRVQIEDPKTKWSFELYRHTESEAKEIGKKMGIKLRSIIKEKIYKNGTIKCYKVL